MASIDSDSVTVDPPREHSSAAGWLWVPLGAAVVALLVVASAYGLVRLAHWTERYRPPVVTQAERNVGFVLAAGMASIQGDNLSLMDTKLGPFIKWSDVYGRASWRFFVPEKGTYDIALTIACADGAQGSDLLIQIAGQELRTVTTSTGDWNTWESLPVGEVTIGRGVHEVHVETASMVGDEVMMLKSIEITPTTSTPTPTPTVDPSPETKPNPSLQDTPQIESEPQIDPQTPEPSLPNIEPAPEPSDPLESQAPAPEDAPLESLDSSEVQPTTPSTEEPQQPQENP